MNLPKTRKCSLCNKEEIPIINEYFVFRKGIKGGEPFSWIDHVYNEICPHKECNCLVYAVIKKENRTLEELQKEGLL